MEVNYLAQFLSMLTLVFAIASIIAGIFTAYFGSGRSRAVGGVLIVIGIIVFIIFMWGAGWITGIMGVPEAGSIFYFKDHILQGIVAIIGGIIGALIALGIFLMAIMKA
jgi:hypothetical protein